MSKIKSLLSMTALGSFALGLLPAQSVAEEAAAATQAANEAEIVVTGRRPIAESDAAAFAAQRTANSIVSVLSADSAGDLPDQNVAFAIGRLPGISLERDQGQARYVNLRGMPRRWSTISYDGLMVVSAEGRESRFDNIPTAIASQITVQKAIVPSMPGDTVAGNVDIRTRRAFDYDGRHIAGKLGLGYVTLGGGEEIDTNIVASDVFLNGKFGVVAQASYYRRNMATENWETDPYLLARAAAPDKRFAREFEYKNYRLIRHNASASLRMDYRFDANNEAFASFIVNTFVDDELRDNVIIRLDQGTNAAGVGYNSDAFFAANDPKSGTVFGARLNGRIDYRKSKDMIGVGTVGGEHAVAGADVSWRVNYTEAWNGSDQPVGVAFQSPSDFLQRPTAVYDFRDSEGNIVRLFRTLGATSARTQGERVFSAEQFNTPATTAFRVDGGELTKAWTAKVDVDRDTQLFGVPTRIEVGAMYTDRAKKNAPTQFNIAPSAVASIPTWSSLASEDSYKGRQPLGFTFRYSQRDRANALIDSYFASGLMTRDAAGALNNYWRVTETLTAAYAMGTSTFGWGNIVYGVRAEQIENSGLAWSPSLLRFVSTSSDDTLFYPSAHVNWDLTDELKLRIGLTSTASRPDYDELRPNFTFNDANQTVSGGNPNAKPEKQKGFDAYLEHYGANGGYLSAGLFYKDIEDVLFTQAGAFGSAILNTGTTDRSGYTLTTTRNAGTGELKGVEVFASQSLEEVAKAIGAPEWMEGFGVKAAATWVESSVNVPAVGTAPARKIKLPGTSDSTYNVQATYEKYGLTLRLAYQYRTSWLQDVGAYQLVGGRLVPTDNGDTFWDSDEEIDFSARYQVNKNLEWFFDAANIGDQPAIRYGDQKQYPIERERFGPRYISGIRFTF